MKVIIGIDPHKASHTAVAVDTKEQDLCSLQVRANPPRRATSRTPADQAWVPG